MSARAPYSDAVRDQAIAWLVRVESDAATVDDWMALEAWLGESDEHRAAFDDVEVLSAALPDEAAELAPVLDPDAPSPGVVDLIARIRPTRRAWTIGAGAIAAGLVAAVGVGLFIQPRTVLYETGRGEVKTVRLDDGTRIDLNGASRLRVRYEGAARRVFMEGAEASFDVARDPARPFVITAADRRITVVGTAFNVRDDGASVTVTVRRGIVDVGAADGSGAARLTAGKQIFHRVGDNRSVVREVQPAEAYAWTVGRLVCRDRRLEDIVADLNRRLPAPMIVEGAARDLRFTGVLLVEDQATVLATLQGYLPVRATREADVIRITSR